MSSIKPVYYIGDVHGRADLLEQLLDFIRERAAAKGTTPVIHFLGDIVDRGPDSCAALELVYKTLQECPGSDLHFGNHDRWFLQAIESDGAFADAETWILNGGWQTIKSYTPMTSPEQAFAYIRAIYSHHVDMLRDARRWSENGPFIIAHAGVDPRHDLETMKNTDYSSDGMADPFLWVRDPFLLNVDKDAAPVIHGHTIMDVLPIVTENRISLDTGAYDTGRLSACFLDPEDRSLTFWQTNPKHLSVVQVEPHLVDRGHGTIYDRLPALFSPQTPAAAA